MKTETCSEAFCRATKEASTQVCQAWEALLQQTSASAKDQAGPDSLPILLQGYGDAGPHLRRMLTQKGSTQGTDSFNNERR